MAPGLTQLPTFPAFEVDTDPTSTATRWTKYVDRFENFLVTMQIDEPRRQKALLLHFAGERVNGIYSALPESPTPLDGDDTPNEYLKAKHQLQTYFAPKKNIEYERYMFRQAKQEPGQSLDQYHNQL